jgi:hypothetical protein
MITQSSRRESARTTSRNSRRLWRTLALLAPAMLASGAVALASAPIKGRTYTGALAHGHVKIVLKVSKSGRSALVTAPYAPLYCESGGSAGPRVITHAVPITATGRFKGTIAYELASSHVTVSRLIFNGRFSGRRVTGVAHTELLLAAIKHCEGSSTFSAKTGKR